MAIFPGAGLDPYEILAPLGAGGMGEVYRARDVWPGREVARETATFFTQSPSLCFITPYMPTRISNLRLRELRSFSGSRFRLLLISMGLAVLFTCFPGVSQAKAQTHSGVPVAEGRAEEFRWQDFLLKNAPEPTLRFAVAHMHKHSSCFGYLYVTREEVRYEVKAPDKDRDHGFRYPLDSLSEARQWGILGTDWPAAEFKLARGGTYHFFRVRESMMENLDPGSNWLRVIVHSGPGRVRYEYPDVRSWGPLVSAVRNFDRALNLANEELAVDRARIPPTASLRAQPATVENGHPVTLTWTTENALSVDLQPGLGTVAASGSTSVTPTHTTIYVLTASSHGGTKIATVQVTVTQPGAPAPSPKALSKTDILDMLKNHAPSARVADLVKQNGIKFAPTSDDLNEIRQAGGGDDLIGAVKQSASAPEP